MKSKIDSADHNITALQARVADLETRLIQHQRRENVYRALADATRAFAAAGLDWQLVLNTIAQKVSNSLGDACTMLLLSADRQWMDHVVATHRDPATARFIQELYRSTPYPTSTGIASQVARSGEPLLRAEVSPADLMGNVYPAYIERVGLASLLIVPLQLHGATIGCLVVTRDQPGNPYTLDDQHFLQDLAHRAVLVIDNARLHREAQAELAARQQIEDQLHLITDTLPVYVAYIDAERRYQFTNYTYQTMYGLHRQQIIGKTMHELLGDEIYAAMRPEVDAALEGQTVLYERSLPHPNGDEMWFTFQYMPDCAPDGAVRGFVSLITDITAQKNTEHAIRSSESRFRAVVESPMLGIGMWSLAKRVTDINAVFLNILGYTEADLRAGALDWPTMTPPEYAAVDAAALREMRATGRCTPYRKEYIRKDGRRVPVLLGGAAFDNDYTEGAFFVVDMTELQRAEREILRLNAALYTRIEQLQAAQVQANWATTRTFYLQEITAAFSQALTPEQVAEVAVSQSMLALDACAGLIGLVNADRTFVNVLSPIGYDQAAVDLMNNVSLDLNIPVTVAIKANQSIWIENEADLLHTYPELMPLREYVRTEGLIALPLQIEAQTIGALILRFTEPRRFAPDERAFALAVAEYCAQAIERARLYGKAHDALRLRDQFMAMAAHELNTPMTTIMGSAQMLQRRFKRGEQASERNQQTVQTLLNQTQRLNNLVKSFLDITRIHEGRFSMTMEPVDFVALTRQMTGEIASTLERHTCELDLPTEPCWVLGDRLRLEQVIQNLLHNAIKYSPMGGAVRVQIVCDEAEVVLRVSDDGIGIPTAELPNIFTRFYRTSNASTNTFTGMGIGLYVSQELVTRHGGTIAVVSAEGMGATFTVRLPLVAE